MARELTGRWTGTDPPWPGNGGGTVVGWSPGRYWAITQPPWGVARHPAVVLCRTSGPHPKPCSPLPAGGRLPSVTSLASEPIRRRLREVPDSPGVYLLRDTGGQVIYVGKALRLRDRLGPYFTAGYGQTARTAELVQRVYDFEFVKTANEVEALVLEC